MGHNQFFIEKNSLLFISWLGYNLVTHIKYTTVNSFLLQLWYIQYILCSPILACKTENKKHWVLKYILSGNNILNNNILSGCLKGKVKFSVKVYN